MGKFRNGEFGLIRILGLWTQSAPEGGLEAIIGWAGMTNPARKTL
jgi:hypothetical protein